MNDNLLVLALLFGWIACARFSYRKNFLGTFILGSLFAFCIRDETTKNFGIIFLVLFLLALFLKFSKMNKTESFKKEETYTSDFSQIDIMDGRDYEYWCANLLTKNGFYNVHVTPGSGDQGVDVVAQKNGIKYAIQCKRYGSALGNTPIQEAAAGKVMYGCQIGVVMTNSSFSPKAVELANANEILLWDRNKLAKMMDNL